MKKSANHVQSNNEMAIPDGMTVFNTEDVDTNKQHMFFGKPLGVQRYDKYKYPVFDKLTQQQLGYFWRPEEVSLQKDRSDYQTLTDQQKHIFTSNLKYQILLDSVQGRGSRHGIHSLCFLARTGVCHVGVGVHGDDTQQILYIYY